MTKTISKRCRHLILLWVLVFALLTAFGCSQGGDGGTPAPQGFDWQEIGDSSKGKIAIITASYTDGSTARGEGFFIENDVIVTGYDVVRLRAGTASLYDIIVTLPDGEKLSLLGVDFSLKNRNIAFLRVTAQDITPVLLGDFDAGAVDDDILYIGMPHAPAWTQNPGSITEITEIGQISEAVDMDWIDSDTRIIEHDTPYGTGSNGGMILNTEGEVIAVLFAGSDGGEDFCTGISINYVISTLNDLSFRTIDEEFLAGCTENPWGFSFVMQGDDPLTRLEELSMYTQVTDHVIIRYLADYDLPVEDQLTSLEGLECLTTIGGSLMIDDNDFFTHINAFRNLTSVGGDLVIKRHHRLTDLKGFRNLQEVGGDLIIGSEDDDLNTDNVNTLNKDLAHIDGFENLTSIGGSLIIKNNPVLPDLENFNHPDLTSVGGDLVIENNDVMVNFPGLDNLESIAGNLTVTGNDALTSLDHLNALTFIGGDLSIDYNTELTTLGLNSLSEVGGDFLIEWNEVCTDQAEALRDQVSISGVATIYHNRDCSP